MAELPINNVNKVNPQLQIKDKSSNMPPFSDLLPLAHRPMAQWKWHQRQRSFSEKECDLDKGK